METQSWLDDAVDCKYITTSQHGEHNAAWPGIGAVVSRMIERADDFCRIATH